MSEKKIPRCYTCHEIVTFDDNHIGKTGRKIPLDPSTKQPHQCKEKITPQEASHPEPSIIEVSAIPKRYPRHEVSIVHGNIDDIEDMINRVLAENDDAGYIHKGVTMLPSLEENVAWYTACIHYEILLPREERNVR